MSLFLTNATLEIEKTAVRLMPFRILRAALFCQVFRVNKPKRCLTTAVRRIFQTFFPYFSRPGNRLLRAVHNISFRHYYDIAPS